MRAKKHLGQHFLEDNAVIESILAAMYRDCPQDFPILEVGPGQGVLTFSLAKHFSQFKAIEFDRDMVRILRKELEEDKVIQHDFLSADLRDLFDGQAFNLVGNFPYNISSQIIFKMIDMVDRIPVMIGMFQKEVAERICSTPGTKKSGIISIRAQAYYDAELLIHVSPDAFNPPPRVDSAVIKLTRKKDFSLPCDPKIFKGVIKMAFGQRRKKMRNTLKSYLDDLSDPIFQERPEQLGVEDFINIAKMIEKQNQKS